MTTMARLRIHRAEQRTDSQSSRESEREREREETTRTDVIANNGVWVKLYQVEREGREEAGS